MIGDWSEREARLARSILSITKRKATDCVQSISCGSSPSDPNEVRLTHNNRAFRLVLLLKENLLPIVSEILTLYGRGGFSRVTPDVTLHRNRNVSKLNGRRMGFHFLFLLAFVFNVISLSRVWLDHIHWQIEKSTSDSRETGNDK